MPKVYAYTSNSNLQRLGEQVEALRTKTINTYADWCSDKEGIDHRSGARDLLNDIDAGDILYMTPNIYQRLTQSKTVSFYALKKLAGVRVVQVQAEELLA